MPVFTDNRCRLNIYPWIMVYAFLVHTLFPGKCKLLYHKIYDFDGPFEVSTTDINYNASFTAKKNVEFVACQVHSEYQFRRAVANRSVEDEVQALAQEDQLPEFELGFLRFLPGNPFPTEKIAVWLGTGNSGFILICQPDENRLLAESVLKLLIQYLQMYLRVLTQPAEVALKADRVEMVLNKLLPDGCLMFMNHRVVRGIERELETLMKT